MRADSGWTCLLAMLILLLQGCATVSPEPASYRIAERPVDPSELKLGSYCHAQTRRKASSDDGDPSVNVAGRVVSVDDDVIVLADAISISDQPAKASDSADTTDSLPIMYRLLLLTPFSSRLFKSCGIGHATTPIPGEVRVQRSSLSALEEIDGTNWSETQNSGLWFQRIGIILDSHSDGDDQSSVGHFYDRS